MREAKWVAEKKPFFTIERTILYHRKNYLFQ